MSRQQAQDAVEAEVGAVYPDKGYAVAYLEKGTVDPERSDVTFSLSKWRGSVLPEPGQQVRLSEIVKFRNGWRAQVAEPIYKTSSHQPQEER